MINYVEKAKKLYYYKKSSEKNKIKKGYEG